MINEISINTFVRKRDDYTLLDVRAPVEFEKGHIPNAHNLPLLSNEARDKVGTTYKNEGREEAILLGFDLTADKWRGFIEDALKIAPKQKVCVHCSRGGMRSSIMAWALDLYGFDVTTIEGGYKSYRHWVLQQFDKEYPLLVLGGMTGSHKTELLMELKEMGEQVIDLEGLAHHQGSVFGSKNQMVQPTQQDFENRLAFRLMDMSTDKPIWIEDESRTVGKRVVPGGLYKQMKNTQLIELQIPKQQRVDFLVQEYGSLDKDFLIRGTKRIQKRLGNKRTREALEAIKDDRMADFIENVLIYYDKAYSYGIEQRDDESVFSLELKINDLEQNAQQLLNFSNQLSH